MTREPRSRLNEALDTFDAALTDLISCPLLLEATQLVQLVDARSNNGSPIGKIQEARGGLPQ